MPTPRPLALAAAGALALPRLRTHWSALGPLPRAAVALFAGFVLAVAFPYYLHYGGRR